MELTKTVFLYLNEKEFSTLTKDAGRANMSISRYIRHQIDNAKMKPTLDMDYEKYINLLAETTGRFYVLSAVYSLFLLSFKIRSIILFETPVNLFN